MLKYIFLPILISSSFLFADILKTGDTIKPFSLPDQFDKVHQVNSKDYKILLIAAQKDIAVMLNDYLKEQSPSFLKDNNAVFISDIHEMPSFVTKLFALPKMRDYPYSLLLIYDESSIFPKKEDALTVLRTKDNKILSIDYISDEKNIEKIFH